MTTRYEYAVIHFNEDGSLKTVFVNTLGKLPDGREFNAGQVTLTDSALVAFLSTYIDASAIAQRDQLTMDLEALQVERDSISNALTEMTAKRDSSLAEYKTIRIERDSIRQQLDSLRIEHETTRQGLDLATGSNVTLLDEVEKAQAEIERLTAELTAALNPPLPDNLVYPYVMQSRFTSAQRRALWVSEDEYVIDLVSQLFTVRMVDVAAESTKTGFGYLAMIGIITSEDVPRFLSPMSDAEKA